MWIKVDRIVLKAEKLTDILGYPFLGKMGMAYSGVFYYKEKPPPWTESVPISWQVQADFGILEGYQIHPNTKVSASPFLFNDTRVSNFPVYFIQIKCSGYETVASCAYPLSEFFDAGLRLQLENITELSNVSQPRRRC